MKMKKNLLFLFIIFSTYTYSQKRTSWTLIDASTIDFNKETRKPDLPSQYSIFEFDYETFSSQLVNVPKRDVLTGESNVVVSLPMPNGKMVAYRVVEASSFDDELQARFPNIRSFSGNEVSNSSNVIRFSLSKENGISATIRSASDETTYIIDPFSMDYKQFIVYDRAFSSGKKGKFNCFTIDEVKPFTPKIGNSENTILNNADDSVLRRFRLAQSCNGEYANVFGATSAAQVNLVLAAYNSTLTRVNALYEQDFNVTMVIVNQSTNVIYYNPATDPYTAYNVGSGMDWWNLELMNTLNNNANVGNANFDIGHLFGANGGGGNAGCIGCVCSNTTTTTTYNNGVETITTPVSYKGSGFTSPSSGLPQGDLFDIDYVAHEYGHQFGGNHTFTTSSEDNAVNVEPGSGVTIMAYAGITGVNTNVASNSISVFHAATIQQITNNVKTKTCDTEIVIANAVPVPSAPATLTLPIGTAFKLVGSATDTNSSDILSYSWEQIDDASGAANLCSQSNANPAGDSDCIPLGSDTVGPNFRSYFPASIGTRMFPRLVDHLANGVTGNKWEVLSNVARTMNFRLTVRDNKIGGGNNESVNTAVTFDATKGPFLITSQNTSGIGYTEGSTQTVTWSGTNTNTMAGAANVNIKLSTDGGLTYPITLLANTANDGSESITFPLGVFAPKCRILVEPTGNNFYAINTKDFAIGYTITTQCTDYTINLATPRVIPEGSYTGISFSVPDSYTISDVNINLTNVTHPRRNQIYSFLRKTIGATNYDADLFQGGACSNAIANLNGTFDDESLTASGCGPTNNFVNMRPVTTLGIFDGLNSSGTWVLAVADITTDNNDGTVTSFTLNLCREIVVEAPVACGVNSTTWNGSAWSNGVPTKNVAIIINGNYSSTSDLSGCSLTVNSGFNVIINSGHTFVITNGVTVSGTGTLTVENNAALRQIDPVAVNTGTIIVKKNSAGMVRLDYTAWGSPVSGQNIKNFSPATLDNRFYEYLYTGTTTPTAYQAVSNVATTNFTIGKGYMIRSANTWPVVSTVFNGQFTGIPFNGNLSVNIGKGYNLLSNPYSSPINITRLFDENLTTIGAVYFWTHTLPASGGIYPVNNFASYTRLGGTAAVAGGAIPNGTIQIGQGFFVRAYDFGNANFTNTQRVNASVSTQFYRNGAALETTESSENHRIWLNLNDTTNNYNQILIGYTNGATNGIDYAIDGEVLDKDNTMLYNVINDTEYVIQGKGLPFTDTDEIALGLKATTAGNYSISLENVDGLFTNQDVYVKDNVTNIVHNIKQMPYTFTTSDGVFNDRFKLVFTNTVLGSESFVNDESVVVFTQNEELKISASQEITSVEVFDVLGRSIYNTSKVNDKTLNIASITNSNQALLVKITFTTGQSVTKKVIK